MTTTELIKILQDNEKGGISHKPRNISLYINGRCMPNPQISLSSTGDGICGPEIDLDIEGEWFEEQPSEDYIRELIREFDNKHPAVFADYMREFNNHPISEIIEYMWDMHDLLEDIKYRLPDDGDEADKEG